MTPSAVILLAAAPTSATVIQTRASASSYWSRLPLVLGVAYEFDIDEEQAVHDFPLLIQYNFSERLQIVIEPNYVYENSRIRGVRSNRGFGDLETRFEAEFLRELRLRPAFSLEGGIKWPTATKQDLGSAGRDYMMGLIISKDFVFAEFDINGVYTASGDPLVQSKLELSASTHVPLGHIFDIEGEVIQSLGIGAFREPKTGISRLHGGATETAATMALVEHLLDHHLMLEQGVTFFNDVSWQLVFGLEWSFAGED
jgi:hypothetical protein